MADKNDDLKKELIRIRGIAITLFAVIFVLGGVLLVFGAYAISAFKLWTGSRADFFVAIAKFIGSTFFIVGLVDVLIEFPSVISYVRDRLEEALQEHSDEFKKLFDELLARGIDKKDVLASVQRQKLEKAHANFVKILSQSDFKECGLFYKTLRNDIEPLLGGVHYEKADFLINNIVKRENGMVYIESTRRIEFLFESHKDTKFDIGFERMFRPLTGKMPSELFYVDLFSIDNVTLIDRAKGKLNLLPEPEIDEDGNIRFLFAPDLISIHKDQKITVCRHERANVPVTDIFRWKIRDGKSLRKLILHCTFNESLYPHIYVNGFPSDKTQKPSEYETSCDLEWDGWMLPYQGIIIDWSEPS